MAELTKLETKLGEVMGLAMAAQAATKKVLTLAKDESDSVTSQLERMHDEAVETARRCEELAGSFDGKKTAILEEASTVKVKGAEMMATYLEPDSDALDGFEFLTMAEAGEVGHWGVLKTLNNRAGSTEIRELVDWALPIQENHYAGVLTTSLALASEEDPNEVA